MSQNNPLVLVGFYQNLPSCTKSRVLKISSVFRMKNRQNTGIDNVFFLKKSCAKMYTIFSAVQRQQRKSYVMTSFGLTACSAVYYHAGSSLEMYPPYAQNLDRIHKKSKNRLHSGLTSNQLCCIMKKKSDYPLGINSVLFKSDKKDLCVWCKIFQEKCLGESNILRVWGLR
jgi:hypothetical protein